MRTYTREQMDRCNERHRDLQRRRKNNGECVRCGEKLIDEEKKTGTRCLQCRNIARKRKGGLIMEPGTPVGTPNPNYKRKKKLPITMVDKNNIILVERVNLND